MLDASGMLVGQPVPADPVFIKNENGKVIAFPSVAVMLISDQIVMNLIGAMRVAFREDMIDLLQRAGLMDDEGAARARMVLEPMPGGDDADTAQAG